MNEHGAAQRGRRPVPTLAPLLAGGRAAFCGDDLIGTGTDLVVTILCGGRPHLLETMAGSVSPLLDALPDAAVLAYVNQHDERSLGLLPPRADVQSSADGKLTSIGVGYENLATRALSSERTWWVHLEDDWKADDPPSCVRALIEAAWVMSRHKDVLQVRLRRHGEPVLRYNQVNRKPLSWTLRDGRMPVTHGHWTFNPALMPTTTARLFTDLAGESDAQHRVHAAHPRGVVAQSLPGVFGHLGNEDSLRETQRTKR